MYIGDRKEREEYMDNLERQMEDQRGRIQRTLDRTEGSADAGGTRKAPELPSPLRRPRPHPGRWGDARGCLRNPREPRSNPYPYREHRGAEDVHGGSVVA